MPTWMVLATVPPLCSLVALWLVLRFLWRVYCAGGVHDLTAAAAAVRRVRSPMRTSSLFSRRPTRAGALRSARSTGASRPDHS